MNCKSILLVEDNPSDVGLTKRALDKNHILNPVVVVEDGEEALQYLWAAGKYSGRDMSEMPAVILLDLKLPKIDGHEVLKRIRADARTRRVPVVVLTSSKEEQDIAASYDLGVNSFIRKPVDFEHFSECVKHLGLYWLIINEPPPKAAV